MKYVGVVKTFHSNTLDEDVSILKYVKDSEGNVPYCLCSRCNKPIKNIGKQTNFSLNLTELFTTISTALKMKGKKNETA